MGDVDADALLAQALWAAEQADCYYNHFNDEVQSDDSEYKAGAAKRRKQQQKANRGRAKSKKKVCAESSQKIYATSDLQPNSTPKQQSLLRCTDEAACNGTEPADGDTGQPNRAAAPETITQVRVPLQQQQQQQQHESSNAAATAQEEQWSETGRRKRRDVGQKREKGRSWNEQEEAAFLAGLETHGRDWKAIGNTIGTRDSRQVASHAQKHFIKLCLAGEPLPLKVADSGRGYTLSGKLLDPHSSAAISYGFNMGIIQGLEGQRLANALAGILPGGMAAGDTAEQPAKDQGIRPPGPKRSRQCNTASQHVQQQLQQNTDTCSDESSKAAADALAAVLAAAPPPLAPSEAAAAEAEAAATSICRTPGNTVVAQHTACAGVVPKEDEAAAAAEVSQAEEPTGTVTGGRDKHNSRSPDKADLGQQNTDSSAGMAEVGGVTAYVRSRPRREGAGSRIKSQLGSTSESLELVCCQDFYGPPGSGLPGSQPFAVEVDMQAMLMMEVHSHLSSCEVIGLLGGTWDVSSRSLAVVTAYPCRRAAGSDAATSVELDPSAEVEVRGTMAAAGQRCVGWYHSHPVFEARPSLKDMENQRNYQALTRDKSEQGGLEPFIGFILGPYDLQLPRPQSAITCFVVQNKGQELAPYSIRYGMVSTRNLPSNGTLAAQIRSLLLNTKHDLARTTFTTQWRCFTAISAAGGLLGPPVSKLDKLLAALEWQCSHVRHRAAVQEWLQLLLQDIEEIWELQALSSKKLSDRRLHQEHAHIEQQDAQMQEKELAQAQQQQLSSGQHQEHRQQQA